MSLADALYWEKEDTLAPMIKKKAEEVLPLLNELLESKKDFNGSRGLSGFDIEPYVRSKSQLAITLASIWGRPYIFKAFFPDERLDNEVECAMRFVEIALDLYEVGFITKDNRNWIIALQNQALEFCLKPLMEQGRS
jgi:hypothetical protein